jgi:radical SAM enzyme (TIGR01210 family)
MCNFGAGPSNLSDAEILSATDKIFSRLDPGVQGIFFAPGGSFFNDNELPAHTRHSLGERLRRFPFLRLVGVETRPAYVSAEQIKRFVAHLPSSVRYFLVGMGLESVTPLVREVCVNKGNDLPAIRKAIEIIKAISGEGDVRIGFELYVLLKPPFLGEREAIDDAVKTIEWAATLGADTIGLFVNVIKPNTLCSFLSSCTDLPEPLRYQPPWWRSAFEVLRRLTPETAGRVQVLGLTSEVPGDFGPRACPLCREILAGTMTTWNYYRDQKLLNQIDRYHCDCARRWRQELSLDLPPLADRLPDDLTTLEKLFDLTTAKNTTTPG